MKPFSCLLFACCLSLSIYGQTCDFHQRLDSIAAIYSIGSFDMVLDDSESLLECPELTTEQIEQTRLWRYKALRNTRKTRKALEEILMVKSSLEARSVPLDFETLFLLAEIHALRRKTSEFEEYIQPIRDSLLPISEINSADLGRLYLIEYYAFDKGAKPVEAANLAQKALAVFDQLEDPPVYYLGNTLRGLGNMNRSIGDFDKAADYYTRELELYESVYPEEHFDVAVCHYNLGAVFYEKLEYQTALDHFLDARKTWVNVFEPTDAYMRNLNEAIGDMYWELDDRDNALKYFNESIAKEDKINNDLSEATLKSADSLWNSGEYDNAIRYYQEAFQWREKTYGKDHMLTGACKNFVARAIRSSGDLEASLDAYQDAINILVEDWESDNWYDNPTITGDIRSYQYLLESLMAKGELLNQRYGLTSDQKDLDAALETQELALTVLEIMKKGNRSESSKLFWTQRTLSLVEKSIGTAVLLNEVTGDPIYLEKAFGYSEQSKALLLTAYLNEESQTQYADVPQEIIDREQNLKKEINEYMGRLESEEKRCAQVRDKMLVLYKTKLQKLQGQYDLLITEIQENYPRYFELKYERNVVPLSDVQAHLDTDDSVLISYFIGEQSAYVFRVEANNISIRHINDPKTLELSVLGLYRSLKDRDGLLKQPEKTFTDYSQAANNLYTELLQPELDSFKEGKLVIVPDGILAYLPFEILLSQDVVSEGRNYRSLPYLFRTHSISYAPSATFKFQSPGQGISNRDYVGFAPQYEGEDYAETRKTLTTLKHNQEEVDFASNLFNGEGFTGSFVTEENLRTAVQRAGIVHLATHGEMEDEYPLLSKLYFNTSAEDDGMLYTYEIYNMNIPAQLVILSACNTATGKLERGEGILSLERAFQYAGSRSMLSTLWTVDDASSSQMVQLFLQNLKAGQSKDIALQQAKISFLETASPENLHPFYWSSFKLTGDTDILKTKSAFSGPLLWIGAFMILTGVVIFRRRQLRNAA